MKRFLIFFIIFVLGSLALRFFNHELTTSSAISIVVVGLISAGIFDFVIRKTEDRH